MAVVCSTSKAAIMASPLQPEHVDQLNGPVGGVVKLPEKLSFQVGDVLKIDSVMRPVPVVSGHPDVQAQIRAELEKQPLDLFVGRLLASGADFFGSSSWSSGTVTAPVFESYVFGLAAVLALIVLLDLTG